MISELGRRALREGSITIRVKRAGMLQQHKFTIKKVRLGSEEFVELFSDRMIDISELKRVANETGLPVEVQNGRAFPDGLGAKDFINVA